MILKQSTATEISFFMPDATDPWTGKTGLTGITVEYHKQGSAAWSALASPTITEVGYGFYRLSVTATVVDTLGFLEFRFTATGAKNQHYVYQVVAYDPYDANALGLARLDATVSSRALQTTADAIKVQTDKMNFTGANINADVKVMSTNATVGGYAAGQAPGEQVLATPSNKIATDTSGRVTVGTNADKTGYALTTAEHSSIASAVWSFVSEGAYTMLQVMRLVSSALLGKVSGAQTNQPVFRDIQDTKNRITMQVDNDGNRTSVTVDGD